MMQKMVGQPSLVSRTYHTKKLQEAVEALMNVYSLKQAIAWLRR
jgi:hypothetical protein